MPKKKARYCRICRKDLKDRPATAKICGSAACTRKRNSLKAAAWARKNLWGKPKRCKGCGKRFKRSILRKKFCSDFCVVAEKARAKTEAKP